MSRSRQDRERELWKLAQTPAGMLELERLHDAGTAMPSGITTEHATRDVGPMITRILEREFPAARPRRSDAAGPGGG